jgi:hypothetical protein
MNHRKANTIWDVASSIPTDKKAQKYLKEEMLSFIQDLGRK